LNLPNQIKIQQEKNRENLIENKNLKEKINDIDLELIKKNKLIDETEENINTLKLEISRSDKEKLEFELNLQDLLKNIEKINYKNSLVNLFFYFFYFFFFILIYFFI
jgi:hypothetical protein